MTCYFWTRLIFLPGKRFECGVPSFRHIDCYIQPARERESGGKGGCLSAKDTKSCQPQIILNLSTRNEVSKPMYIIAGKLRMFSVKIIGMSCKTGYTFYLSFFVHQPMLRSQKSKHVNLQLKLSRDKTHWRVFVIWKVVFVFVKIFNMLSAWIAHLHIGDMPHIFPQLSKYWIP